MNNYDYFHDVTSRTKYSNNSLQDYLNTSNKYDEIKKRIIVLAKIE